MDGHSAMAAMQDGRRSGRFPQNDTHGIELVDRYPDTTGNWRARRAHSKHAPQLENDQRGRDDLPGVIHMLYRKSQINNPWCSRQRDRTRKFRCDRDRNPRIAGCCIRWS
jgi:hypothetical protein